MDLKAVLLQSTSTDQTLSFRTRCHIGKECYTIAYKVHRKFLTLTLIRRVRSKLQDKVSQRRKRKGPRMLLPSRQTFSQTEYVSRATQTDSEEPKPICVDNVTQTPHATKANKPIQTDPPHATCNKALQTKPISQCPHGVQTERNLISVRTQTEFAMVSRCQSTECAPMATCACQTEVSLNSVVTQTDTSQIDQLERFSVEREAVVLLLNEIGEMIINQNQLLNHNSTLLGQLTEQSLMQGQLSSQRLRAQQKMHKDKMRAFAAYKAKRRRTKVTPNMCPSNKRFVYSRSPEVSDKHVQVDISKSCCSSGTQTGKGGSSGGGGDGPKRRLSNWNIFKHN